MKYKSEMEISWYIQARIRRWLIFWELVLSVLCCSFDLILISVATNVFNKCLSAQFSACNIFVN